MVSINKMKENYQYQFIHIYGIILTIADEDEDDSDFNTCLKFVIKSKLEKDGVMIRQKEDGSIEEVKTWEDAIQKAQGYVSDQQGKKRVVKEKKKMLQGLG